MKTILFLMLCGSLTAQNFFKLSAGYFTGHIAHEFGHLIANEKTGTDYRFDNGKIVSITGNHKHARTIACAGFCGEFIATQFAFIGQSNDYKTGIILHGIINPLGYVVRDRFFKNGGDLDSYSKFGGDKKILRTFLIAGAGFNLFHLYIKSKKLFIYSQPDRIGVTYAI